MCHQLLAATGDLPSKPSYLLSAAPSPVPTGPALGCSTRAPERACAPEVSQPPAVLGDSPDLSLCAVHSPRVHSMCFAASALCAFSGTLLALLTLRSCDALLLWGHSQVLPLFSLCLLENYVTILGSFFFIQDAILIPVYCATVHTKKK